MSSLNNRGWSSRDQNNALRDLNELLNLVVGMYSDVAEAICRNRYSPGVKKKPKPGELGEMEGTPPPAYGRRSQFGDPIGEDACWPDEIDDLIDRRVKAMVQKVRHVANTARWMKDQSARRTIEVEMEEYLQKMCQACRTAGHSRLILGYCRPCYDRWVYLGRPNRITFERQRRSELGIPEIPTDDPESEKTRPGLSDEIPTPLSTIERRDSEIQLSVKGSPGQMASLAPPAPTEGNDEQVRRANS